MQNKNPQPNIETHCE